MVEVMRERCLSALSVLVVVLMAAIVAQVAFSAFDVNPLITFSDAMPVLGKAITLNSLLDFQWHLLVLVGLLPAGFIWLMDRHVRVDFLYQHQAARWQARINLTGNLLFAVPLFVLILPASLDFMERAWRSGEGSRNGGLNDLWLIKSMLPFGLTLLALAVLVESIRLVRAVR